MDVYCNICPYFIITPSYELKIRNVLRQYGTLIKRDNRSSSLAKTIVSHLAVQ